MVLPHQSAGTLPRPDKDVEGEDAGGETKGDNSARTAADVCEIGEHEGVDDIDVLVDVAGVFVGVDDDVRIVCFRTSEYVLGIFVLLLILLLSMPFSSLATVAETQ